MNALAAETTTGGGSFQSTRWSVVLAAGETDDTAGHAHRALSELCRIYWRPLYFFLRRHGSSSADAQDLTQGFFADFIATRAYTRTERGKGRFRSFLLGALKRFLADARDYAHAQKRGGGILLVPLDQEAITEVEARFASAEGWSTEESFDREWAAAVLRQAFNRLGEESALAGKGDLFAALKPHLSATADDRVPYEEISRRLQRPAVTLRSDVLRLRSRYRTILREEVRDTVAEDGEVDEELRYLCRVLATA
jgi:RNA polymerase sigma factor (sigma-70 family)